MIKPKSARPLRTPRASSGRLSSGTIDHYSCFLPRKLGRLRALLLKMFYSGIALSADLTGIIDQIPKNAIIVYVNKNKSRFEYLYYHTAFARRGYPVPEIGLDYRPVLWQPVGRLLKIFFAQLFHFLGSLSFRDPYTSGYVQNELLDGKAGFLSLVDKGEFYRRFLRSKIDPLEYLVEFQKKTDRPIYLVPLLMFFSKNPYRSNPTLIDMMFGSEGKPGTIRRLIALFRNPGKVFTEIGTPVNLMAFLYRAEIYEKPTVYQSLYLRRFLLRQINRHRQTITGPVLKSPEELKENILTAERFQEFLAKLAESRNTPIYKLRKEAAANLSEIAAKYSTNMIKIASMVVGYIVDTMFEGVSFNSDGLKYVKSASQNGPLVLIPCHKSHIDYLILSYILYHNNMPCPHVAAGKNLSFWPIGPLFRRGGAFFIRRSFRGAVLYARVFAEYLYKLLEEGFNVEFFIEGTRSRTGKMILPKLGFLSMLFEAFRTGACEEMIFVPVYIGYDRVLEESSYINELSGGQKEPENFRQVLNARRFLKKRYGKIYLRFHEPLSLSQLLRDQGLNIHDISPKEKNTFCRNLGFRIVNAINKQTVITAHGLCACAILNIPRPRFTRPHLKPVIDLYLRYLGTQGAQLADTLLIDQEYAIDNALTSYGQRKFIESVAKSKEDVAAETEYTVNESQRTTLEYYKNNCVAFFIPAAFTALEILHLDAFQFAAADIHNGYRYLQHLFKNEFAYDIDLNPEYIVRKTLKILIDDAILIPHQTLPDTYNITSAGFRKLKLFAAFLTTYFETYLVVLNHFLWAPPDGLNPKERLKKIEARGRRMYKRKEIGRRESLSRVTYENAADFFTSQGIKSSEDIEKTEPFAVAINRYLSRLH
ncbi:MAG: 1-acyl-sn-glycerol-3-phosphate acyltransferase [Desulfobacterales bacterium]